MAIAPGYEKESTLTRKSQITIPREIIRMLGLKEGDKVKLFVQKDGTVLLSRVEEVKEDPVLEKFLNLLEKDIEENPFHLKSIPNDLLERAVELVGHLDVNLDEDLQDDEELEKGNFVVC
ncbi:type II toxin-antitoxin system PrlF family antitoxin [Gloeocapsopsis dulcis]|uniref:SpoVT-AbrB domain-containing protein n=1 Tax=Gloeocapsopsis dulcis AAB1 = 1H9 TaxID=1433147 RepID=A0A6N8G103_9CHRO|nr:type II toxin-antitoxin system PrlF family antitoxin [Gloeocapsopsis dulcis]MUL39080.1 hypothetical protein [Gloeocapsopsis dulcis AAB1 = 1H9]WNN92138.1 type II toxin-antitoxin system PrlF family antitoxin [Gloeocapsopsis dulcis]